MCYTSEIILVEILSRSWPPLDRVKYEEEMRERVGVSKSESQISVRSISEFEEEAAISVALNK